MLLQHKKCGVIYNTNKTSFLKGAFCPICTPRYSTEAVMHALQSCTNGTVSVQTDKHRGRLSIILPNGQCTPNLTFRNVMDDLSAETPEHILCRTRRYRVPETKAHMIFMSVKKAEKRKGFWEFRDGVTNETGETIEIDRCMRNYIQDLAQKGYLVRISKGKYRTANENDWTVCKNRTK